jgi:hypothetical protein
MAEQPIGGGGPVTLAREVEMEEGLGVPDAPFGGSTVLLDLETECRKRQRAIVPRLHAAIVLRVRGMRRLFRSFTEQHV